VGFDVGTGNLVVACQIDDKVQINSMRNAFISVDPQHVKASQMAETDLSYIELLDENGQTESLCILSEDAFKFSNIFGSELRRPMKKGVISQSDVDSPEIIARMIKSLAGDTKDGKCIYSIPAQAIDDDSMAPVSYHTKLFKKIFKSLGYDAEPLNEAKAIIFSECSNSNFSGIGISFGCGMTNFNLSYKGVTVAEFSLAMGGDWIDEASSKASASVVSRVTNIKEQYLDLTKTSFAEFNKNERRILETLAFYYEDFLEQIIEHMINQFKEISDDLNANDEIPIIISGGTSLPNGFDTKFKEIFNNYKFPYKISEIRRAADPLNAVAKGCLIYAYWLENKK
jgi:actin-like ATPase involved in cell morphogenesis